MVFILCHIQNEKLQRVSPLFNSIELLNEFLVSFIKMVNILNKLTTHLILLQLPLMLLLHLHQPLLDVQSIGLFLLKQIIHRLLGLILETLIQLTILQSHLTPVLKSHLFDSLSLPLDIFLIVNLKVLFDEILILNLHPDGLFFPQNFLLNLLQSRDLSFSCHFNILQRVLAIHKIYKKYKKLSFCD